MLAHGGRAQSDASQNSVVQYSAAQNRVAQNSETQNSAMQNSATSFNPGKVDALGTYVETALSNNPGIQQKWSEYKASLERLPQVGSLPNPVLSLGFYLKPMEQLSGNQVANLQLMQDFPWFGVLKNAKDEMSLMAQAGYASFEAARLDIAYDVRVRWYELYQNRQLVAIVQTNLSLVRQLRSLSTAEYAAGGTFMAPGMPLTQGATGMASQNGLPSLNALQQEENELNNQLVSLEDAYNYLVNNFNILLNRDVTTPIEIPQATIKDGFEPPTDTVINQHPMLTMLHYEREAREAKKKMAERMGYPMVGVGLSYSLMSKNPASTSMMNGRDMLMPMVSISLPLNRKKYNALKQEIEWQQTATTHAQEATRNSLQVAYQEALFQYRDAKRREKLAENQLELLASTFRIQETRLAASNGSLADLLQTARQQADQEQQRLNAAIDVLKAQARIRQLTGTL